jgi:hypothetical protein
MIILKIKFSKMNTKDLLLLSILCISMTSGFTSCSNEGAYDSNYATVLKTNEYNKNWTNIIGSIDPNQNWNMFSNRKVTVNINLGTSDIYTIKVFDKDPGYPGSKAQLIATANAEGGKPISFNVDLPTSMDTIYVGCALSDSMAVIEPAVLNGNSYTINFGNAASASAVKTRAGITQSSLVSATDYDSFDGQIINEIHDYLSEGIAASPRFRVDYSFVSQGLPFYVDPIYGCEGNVDEIGYVAYSTTGKSTYHKLISNTQDDSEIGNLIKLFWTQLTYRTYTSYWGYYSAQNFSDVTKTNVDIPFSFNYINNYDKFWEATSSNYKATNSITIGRTNYGCDYLINKAPEKVKSKGFIVNEPAGTIITFYVKSDNQYMYTVQSKNSDGQYHSAVLGSDLVSKNNPDGYTIVGLEDAYGSGGDHDCNDIIFAVKGAPVITNTTSSSYKYTMAFEDLGSTNDYDFNDVVINVSYTEKITTSNNASDVKEVKLDNVYLMAAGGTLPTHVYYKNGNSVIDLFGEVHEAFGVSTSTMVNTGSGTEKSPVLSTKLTDMPVIQIATSDLSSGFYITVTNNDNTISTVSLPNGTALGQAPQGLIMPDNWNWPKERVNITDAYPLFGKWGANKDTNVGWHKNSIANKVIKINI